MVVGLLGNESSDSNRLTLVTPKSENDVRLQATLDNQNPTGLPVGVVSYNGKEYVDKSPLFLDSTCPLSQAYHQLAAKKANRAKLMEETMRKKRK